jgi:tetratricopeptide (TPR) repeat protein
VRDALRGFVEREPESALGWLWLARLEAAEHVYDTSGSPPPIEAAIASAQHAVRVDPASRAARCSLAWALIVKGEVRAAREELEQGLRSAPDSLAYLEMAGFLLALAGEHERGAALCREALARNPRCLNHAYFGLWYHHGMRGDHAQAYQAAFDCRDGIFFLRGVMRVSSLGHLGRASEAAAEIAGILRMAPAFRERGRMMLGRFLKSPEALDRVVEGLDRAGLRLGSPGLAAK